ncbi:MULTISPECIES: hypothetical protein [Pseudomonas]|uniref:Uncharacterized protein n=1 Tax=Pseudomonas wuhanensis TaxID=2954098 RepID=A0ABY9GP84_9PSED|nr:MULTISPECIES: hypothetical protein [unclassified Pseudomonas]WLI11736.1 hypothetical protein PSH65_26965 [Pseudomonas sp. FP603]WLI17577.1 hypothetical protein PSH88_25600 [Pseudomonas sp. FP607]
MSQEKMLYGACALLLLGFMLINLIVMFYVAFFKLDEIEKLLKSSAVLENDHLTGSGPISRLMRLSRISGLLCASTSFLQQTDPLAISDIAQFPAGLRLWVNIPFHIATFFIVCMVALWGWGKYTGLLS